MRRFLIVLNLLLISYYCFSQQNIPSRIIGNIPNINSRYTYQIQVGAYRNIENVNNIILRLRSIGINPVTENYNNFTRVIITDISALQVEDFLFRLKSLGFNEVLIREDKLNVTSQYSSSQSFLVGKIMYVNSLYGLKIYAEPSVNSRIIGNYFYGEAVVLYDKSNIIDAIEGITDYWYMLSDDSWVFGGYLSENLPSNVPIISGIWEDARNHRSIYYFNLNHTHFIGGKEAGGIFGKWEILGNMLTIIVEGEDSIGYFNDSETFNERIIFFNNNHIKLIRENGMEIELIRSKNIYY